MAAVPTLGADYPEKPLRSAPETSGAGIVLNCTNATQHEVFARRLFASPNRYMSMFEENIVVGETPLFLVNMSNRKAFGVFFAEEPPAKNIEPKAFIRGRRTVGRTMFPAQIRFCRAQDAPVGIFPAPDFAKKIRNPTLLTIDQTQIMMDTVRVRLVVFVSVWLWLCLLIVAVTVCLMAVSVSDSCVYLMVVTVSLATHFTHNPFSYFFTFTAEL